MIKMRTSENQNIQLHAYIYYTFIFACSVKSQSHKLLFKPFKIFVHYQIMNIGIKALG